jgi:peptidoglycan hydrolase CwlO-like protein
MTSTQISSLGNLSRDQLNSEKTQCSSKISIIDTILASRDASQTPDSRFSDIISQSQAAINALNTQTTNITAQINAINTLIASQQTEIANANSSLDTKKTQLENLNRLIEDKMKLIDTRNRMLQVVIEKNSYKKKVIYTLISVIIAIVIIMLVAYVYFNKKK